MSQKLEKALSDSLGGMANTHDGLNVNLTPDGGIWVGWKGEF